MNCKFSIFLSILVVIVHFGQLESTSFRDGENNMEEVNQDDLSPEMEELLVKKKKRYDCPLCDPSVFSYCSDKLLHDACCCISPYESELPMQCRFADCSFLHANSCDEHKLITACCCNQLAHNRAK